jgi:DNA-binding beta-propeller fold protein YncE
MRTVLALAVVPLAACGAGSHSAPTSDPAGKPATAAPGSEFSTTTIALPGASADGIFMDYLLFDPRTNAVWVPAGNTGAVDVIDVASGRISQIGEFATQELERRGRKRMVGPSSATLGARGTVYIGNRGDFSICAVDELSLHKGTCGKLDAMPDGIAYVEKTQEVWVTTPRDKSIRVLDAATLVQKAKIDFEGEPEGFAPDNARGRFYTNLEDKDVTLSIDLESRKVVATWKPACGEDGPHGLRLADRWLLVACSARVVALDVTQGTAAGSFDTGDGVDDLDYAQATRRVYAGAAQAGTLAVATLDDHGALSLVAKVATKQGARNGAVTHDGRVYLSSSKTSEVVVVAPR